MSDDTPLNNPWIAGGVVVLIVGALFVLTLWARSSMHSRSIPGALRQLPRPATYQARSVTQPQLEAELTMLARDESTYFVSHKRYTSDPYDLAAIANAPASVRGTVSKLDADSASWSASARDYHSVLCTIAVHRLQSGSTQTGPTCITGRNPIAR